MNDAENQQQLEEHQQLIAHHTTEIAKAIAQAAIDLNGTDFLLVIGSVMGMPILDAVARQAQGDNDAGQ